MHARSQPGRTRGRRFGSAGVRLAIAGLLALGTGCKKRQDTADVPGAQLTKFQADRRIKQAIRQSSEGVIILPSRKANVVYELPRLTEIAHELRQPAAACFLERALETMEADPGSDLGYSGVPDGQAKLRLRISPAGHVLRAETLESGFTDTHVPECVGRAIKRKKFPENETGTNQFIDLVFWISLGAQPGGGDKARAQLIKREQTEAAVKARNCLEGRVPPGEYVVEGLNLIGRDGKTVANRVAQAQVSDGVRACLVAAFREIRLSAEPDTFLRPLSPRARFVVHETVPDGKDSKVTVDGEEWLRLVRLEERAKRAKQREALKGGADAATDDGPTRYIDEGEPGLDPNTPETEPPPVEDPNAGADPGQGGYQAGPRRPRQAQTGLSDRSATGRLMSCLWAWGRA